MQLLSVFKGKGKITTCQLGRLFRYEVVCDESSQLN